MFPSRVFETDLRFAPLERGGSFRLAGSINISSLRDEEAGYGIDVLGSFAHFAFCAISC